jgi:tellurium resistance protein TerD
MGVSLSKGGNVSLTKEAPYLVKAAVGLGWDARGATAGADFDLDASALMIGANGKVPGDGYFIFFNNKVFSNESVVHTGDNLTGEGEGDDETINVNLATVPAHVERIVFVVDIYKAMERGGQNFGQVRNAYIRITDQVTGVEVARYDLTEDAANLTTIIFGELYRHAGEWKFRAVGQGYATGLRGIAQDFGVNVG